MTIEEYFGDWSNIIDLTEADRIVKSLASSKTAICPLVKDIFKSFHLCLLRDLRVVVIGQDCYPDFYKGKPRATGIAFANSSDVPEEFYSPSLAILKESLIDYTIPHGRVNFDPSLEKLEEQGVLFLNTALSCAKGKVGSHLLMWRPFIKSLLINLSKARAGVVYVLMGEAAASLEPYINKDFNHIIRIRHPAWYARNKTRMPSDVWRDVNKILIGQNGYGIEWYEEVK